MLSSETRKLRRWDLLYRAVEAYVTWDVDDVRKKYISSAAYFTDNAGLFSRLRFSKTEMTFDEQHANIRFQQRLEKSAAETLYMLMKRHCPRPMYPEQVFLNDTVSRMHLRLRILVWGCTSFSDERCGEVHVMRDHYTMLISVAVRVPGKEKWRLKNRERI